MTTSHQPRASSASSATCCITSCTSKDIFSRDARPAHTFWTGCGMIKRQVFLDFGGFDPRLYPRPAIEDIELGYRLTRAGHRIILARDVLATHLKRWTLREMVRTDIFRRGVPWALLIKRSQTVETDLNVKPGQKFCVALTALVVLALLAMPVTAWAGLAVAAGSAAIVALNGGFYRFLIGRRGFLLHAGRASRSSDLLHLLRAVGDDRSLPVAYERWCTQDASALRAASGSTVALNPFPGRSGLGLQGGWHDGQRDQSSRGSFRPSPGAVAEALALLADDLRRRVAADPNPVIVPNLDTPSRPWACTHRDTVSAAADAVLSAGARSIAIAGTATADAASNR